MLLECPPRSNEAESEDNFTRAAELLTLVNCQNGHTPPGVLFAKQELIKVISRLDSQTLRPFNVPGLLVFYSNK